MSPVAGNLRDVGVQREQDAGGAHLAARRAHAPRLHRQHGRLLVDRRAAPLGGVRQAAGELGGVEQGRAAREGAAEVRGDAHDLRQLRGLEPAVVRLGHPRGPLCLERVLQARGMGGVRRERDAAVAVEVRLDPLGFTHLFDLVRRRHDGVAQRAASLRVARDVGWQAVDHGHAPAAVAPRRAEARDLALEHRDAQRRVGDRQVVGGPEAGEAAPDDGHVHLEIAGQGGPRLGLRAERIEPVAERAVGHDRGLRLPGRSCG